MTVPSSNDRPLQEALRLQTQVNQDSFAARQAGIETQKLGLQGDILQNQGKELDLKSQSIDLQSTQTIIDGFQKGFVSAAQLVKTIGDSYNEAQIAQAKIDVLQQSQKMSQQWESDAASGKIKPEVGEDGTVSVSPTDEWTQAKNEYMASLKEKYGAKAAAWAQGAFTEQAGSIEHDGLATVYKKYQADYYAAADQGLTLTAQNLANSHPWTVDESGNLGEPDMSTAKAIIAQQVAGIKGLDAPAQQLVYQKTLDQAFAGMAITHAKELAQKSLAAAEEFLSDVNGKYRPDDVSALTEQQQNDALRAVELVHKAQIDDFTTKGGEALHQAFDNGAPIDKAYDHLIGAIQKNAPGYAQEVKKQLDPVRAGLAYDKWMTKATSDIASAPKLLKDLADVSTDALGDFRGDDPQLARDKASTIDWIEGQLHKDAGTTAKPDPNLESRMEREIILARAGKLPFGIVRDDILRQVEAYSHDPASLKVIEDTQQKMSQDLSPVAKDAATLLHASTLGLIKKNAKSVEELDENGRKAYAALVKYEEEGMMDLLEGDADGKIDASKAQDIMIEKVSKILSSGALQFTAAYNGPKAGSEDAALAKYLQMHAQGGSEVSVNSTGGESYLGSSEVEAKDMTARAQARIEQAVPGVKLTGNALESGDKLGMSTTGDRIFESEDGKQYKVASLDGKKTVVEEKVDGKWTPIKEKSPPDIKGAYSAAAEAQDVKRLKADDDKTQGREQRAAFENVFVGTSIEGKKLEDAFQKWDKKEPIYKYLQRYQAGEVK